MKFLARVSVAPEAKSAETKKIALVYAGLLTLMVLGQLFAYEKFPALLEAYQLPGGVATAHLLAAVIVISEVFALPFLLRMKTSPLMRYKSMACSWLIAVIWLTLGIILTFANPAVANVGLLGAKMQLEPGIWALCVPIGMVILSIWASWGMWPHTLRKKH